MAIDTSDVSPSAASVPSPTSAGGSSSSANPGASSSPNEALGLRFQVHVDDIGDLGDWQKCEGLTVEYDIFEYKEGGENGYIHRLPGRAKYQNIKLTRPINPDSALVAKWVAKVMTENVRSTVWIRVLDASGTQVVQWNLVDAFPARWTGPTLDVTANNVATEQLEIAHNGFIGN